MFVPLETSSREFGPPVKTLPHQKAGGESTLQRLSLIPAFAQIDKRKERHQEQDSPRRLAAAFTHKRDVAELYDAQPEQLAVFEPARGQNTRDSIHNDDASNAVTTKHATGPGSVNLFANSRMASNGFEKKFGTCL
ncbi:hypothetical protein PC120_g12703 [Phytophthora cactorum]|nr:hypothetical protein PC120_g12703 [Phytophthora cactorum]